MTTRYEEPLDDYRVALRRARMRSFGTILTFLVGLPLGAAAGWAGNVVLLGDYGGSSVLFFMVCGAITFSFGGLALVRVLARP